MAKRYELLDETWELTADLVPTEDETIPVKMTG